MCELHPYVLYVEEVFEAWPEDGRARKVVSLDEAIDITSKQGREELSHVLREVREKQIHLKG